MTKASDKNRIHSLFIFQCTSLPAPSHHHTPGIPSRPVSVGQSILSRSHTPHSGSLEPLERPGGRKEKERDLGKKQEETSGNIYTTSRHFSSVLLFKDI